jgi:hypothetical protein
MTLQTRKHFFNAARVGICVAALVLVIRGVTWHDRIMLKDGSTLMGRVTPGAESIRRVPSERGFGECGGRAGHCVRNEFYVAKCPKGLLGTGDHGAVPGGLSTGIAFPDVAEATGGSDQL